MESATTPADERRLLTPQEYEDVQQSADFAELRRRFRAFSIPMTVAFIVWYFAYVLMSAFASDIMSIKLLGAINLGLAWGLAQFATTFLLTWLYIRRANRKIDPIASRLRDDLEARL